MLLLQKSSDSYKKLFKDHREPKEPPKPGDDNNSQDLDAEKGTEPKTQEELLSKIKEKKEVIEQLRCQPWNMHRKRRTLMLAQRYLQQHECKVSKAHLYREEIEKRWKQMHRFFDNTSIYLIPWQTKIKTIESRFGSVVSSYFIFLRWIFWINFIITIMIAVIVVLPEVLADNLTTRLKNPRKAEIYSRRKIMTPEQNRTADMLQVVWDFGGYLEKSPIFYGYYSNETYLLHDIKYRLPLSYLLVNFLILGYSFFAILR
uniref:Uncharacterized protein n=1 Tax=Romanomermis culicivorax TaxID=13658 RepID=A0A915HJJ9_ROMCU